MLDDFLNLMVALLTDRFVAEIYYPVLGLAIMVTIFSLISEIWR